MLYFKKGWFQNRMRYPQTNPTNRPIAQAMSNKISSSVINEKNKGKKMEKWTLQDKRFVRSRPIYYGIKSPKCHTWTLLQFVFLAHWVLSSVPLDQWSSIFGIHLHLLWSAHEMRPIGFSLWFGWANRAN